ncbi:hypothetical protein TNCV_1958881 [Trichonephila clavipes]|nr:hypothetical protein TNCV_1958881 [Trichonephila clavipes]
MFFGQPGTIGSTDRGSGTPTLQPGYSRNGSHLPSLLPSFVPEPDEIGHWNEEVTDFVRNINLQVVSDDVQELLDSHNQDLTIVELIEMQEQDIKKLQSLDPSQSKDRMMVETNNCYLRIIPPTDFPIGKDIANAVTKCYQRFYYSGRNDVHYWLHTVAFEDIF